MTIDNNDPNYRYFEVTSDHIKLLKRMNFRNELLLEMNLPALDAKRPFGNSDVVADVLEIIGAIPEGENFHDWINELSSEEFDNVRKRAFGLIDQLPTVLMILTQNLAITEGIYVSKRFSENYSLLEVK